MSEQEALDALAAADAAYERGDWVAAADQYLAAQGIDGFPEGRALDVAQRIEASRRAAEGGDATTGVQGATAAEEQEFFDLAGTQDAEAAARARHAEAEAMYQAGDFENAANSFLKLIGDPGIPESGEDALEWTAACAYAQLGRWDDAFDLIGRTRFTEAEFRALAAEQRWPGDPEVDARIAHGDARLLYEQGEYEAALQQFLALLQLPGLPEGGREEVHFNIAAAHARMGDWDGARSYATANGVDPAEVERDVVANGGAAPGEGARDQFLHAQELALAGDAAGAVAAFTALLSHPELPAEHVGEIHENIARQTVRVHGWQAGADHAAANGVPLENLERWAAESGIEVPAQPSS